ncbi:hypothetical protein L6452_41090 [Arctium lappa]|uniref:Uncharacterized protein n=1 Tax=Arctium lappa TaxID=4217 RepID=A0ACB8XP76_ARCLA|nr:hypothetical protein L6452_41090 [Arctium lappa]
MAICDVEKTKNGTENIPEERSSDGDLNRKNEYEDDLLEGEENNFFLKKMTLVAFLRKSLIHSYAEPVHYQLHRYMITGL